MKLKKNLKLFIVLIAIIILMFVLVVFLLNRNSGGNNTPRELIKEYMEMYKKLDKSIVKDIKYPFDDELSNVQKERYEGIVKLKYEQMSYNIIDNEDTFVSERDAVINVQVSTIDIKAAYEKASTYVENHKDEFKTVSDEIEYKLDVISKYDLREEYQISFRLYKQGDKWKLLDLSKADLKKIQGLY